MDAFVDDPFVWVIGAVRALALAVKGDYDAREAVEAALSFCDRAVAIMADRS